MMLTRTSARLSWPATTFACESHRCFLSAGYVGHEVTHASARFSPSRPNDSEPLSRAGAVPDARIGPEGSSRIGRVITSGISRRRRLVAGTAPATGHPAPGGPLAHFARLPQRADQIDRPRPKLARSGSATGQCPYTDPLSQRPRERQLRRGGSPNVRKTRLRIAQECPGPYADVRVNRKGKACVDDAVLIGGGSEHQESAGSPLERNGILLLNMVESCTQQRIGQELIKLVPSP